MTEDVSRIGGSLHTVLDTITGGFLQILAIAVVMFLQNWQLSLAVIAFMPVSIAIAGPLSLLVPIPIIFVIAGVIPPALALIALLAGRMRQTEDSQPLDAD